jgi:hypothetical protein
MSGQERVIPVNARDGTTVVDTHRISSGEPAPSPGAQTEPASPTSNESCSAGSQCVQQQHSTTGSFLLVSKTTGGSVPPGIGLEEVGWHGVSFRLDFDGRVTKFSLG